MSDSYKLVHEERRDLSEKLSIPRRSRVSSELNQFLIVIGLVLSTFGLSAVFLHYKLRDKR